MKTARTPRPNSSRKPKPKPRRRREPRIRAIVAAAELVFLEKGFDIGSLDDVARRANASKATIYAHFGNKLGLFREIIRDKIAAVAQPLDHATADKENVRVVLRQFGTAFITTLLSPVALKFYRLMVSQGTQFPELAQTWFANGPRIAIGTLAAFLKDRTEAGELDIENPELAAEFFLMSLRGVVHLRALTGLAKPPFDKDVSVRIAGSVDMFMRAYGLPKNKDRR